MRNKLVLGVIGADCHAVGNRILARILTDAGFDVENLGVMVSQEEFVSAAKHTDAKAILVSSIYGHGELDCMGLRELCDDEGLNDIILYVGGNLVIGKLPFEEVEARFLKLGYDRAFPANCDLAEVIQTLKQDIEIRSLGNIGHNSKHSDAFELGLA